MGSRDIQKSKSEADDYYNSSSFNHLDLEIIENN
jgi:hypothetical protein